MPYKLLFKISLLFLFLGNPMFCFAEYSGVYDVWYDTTKYPETAEEQLAKNQNFFDDRFYSCLGQVRQKSMWGSNRWTKMCNETYSDPSQWAGCNSSDEAGKIATWAREMEAATRGEVRWSQTINYLATITGKRALGARMYENIVDQTAPSVRTILFCE